MFRLQLWFGVSAAVSHRVVKHHVLFGQLQQHRIVEELADAHILAQTLQNNKCGMSDVQKGKLTKHKRQTDREKAHLAPSGLDHKLSGQVGGGLRLKRPDHNTLVQRVTRDNLTKKKKDIFKPQRRCKLLVKRGKISPCA